MDKSHQVYLMNLREQKKYDELNKLIGQYARYNKNKTPFYITAEDKVSEAFTKIEELKQELNRAKRIRRNRQGSIVTLTIVLKIAFTFHL